MSILTHYRIVGFTGTRWGMSEAQLRELRMFADLHGAPEEVHHGDCIGADATLHNLAREWGSHIVVHPPSNARLRAGCEGDEHHQPRPYMERNRAIVDASDLLLATPWRGVEEKRSGTWATVRYAERAGVELCLFYPEGGTGWSAGRKSARTP